MRLIDRKVWTGRVGLWLGPPSLQSSIAVPGLHYHALYIDGKEKDVTTCRMKQNKNVLHSLLGVIVYKYLWGWVAFL